jgi:hypothetical protein
MNEKVKIDYKISRFSYFNSYAIYWGSGSWCENGYISYLSKRVDVAISAMRHMVSSIKIFCAEI